ncbi:hypothetical protein A9B99_08715 [Mangrovibacter phragmitis]|uniref:Uncharacterized protein n=1 Tax=Mangrovibacter phragmitis TaxID=1691903 RepID=A0A1B7L1X7_9ENTR|nr:hypothetical protein A9B99_08715 [Mangrovibacter phragmitis]
MNIGSTRTECIILAMTDVAADMYILADHYPLLLTGNALLRIRLNNQKPWESPRPCGQGCLTP